MESLHLEDRSLGCLFQKSGPLIQVSGFIMFDFFSLTKLNVSFVRLLLSFGVMKSWLYSIYIGLLITGI